MVQRTQEGYVYKRGAAKVWYGRFREDVLTPNGIIVRRTRNVRLGTINELPSRTSAERRLKEQMAPQKPKTVITFAELHKRWEVAEVPTIKASTASYYQKILRAHVLPVFGRHEITKITREDLQVLLAEKAPKYTKNTLRGIRVSLGKMLSWAVANKYLEDNPCSKIKLPVAGKEEATHRPLKTEQVIAIANQLKEPYSTLVLFLAVTGLRIGEVVGIKWSDVDGDILTVSRTIYEGKAQSPKTQKSFRSLPIPAILLERMRKIGGSEYIFRSRTGTPLNPGNALKRHIRPVAEKLGIVLDGWHAFRRTVATTLLRRGQSAKLVSDILGNSVEILLKAYDLPEAENYRFPLAQIAWDLLPNVTNLAPGA
jgi:integrase